MTKFRIYAYWISLWFFSLIGLVVAPSLIKDFRFSNISTILYFLFGLGVGVIVIGVDEFAKKKSTELETHLTTTNIHRSRSLAVSFLLVYGLITRDNAVLISLGVFGLVLGLHLSVLLLRNKIAE